MESYGRGAREYAERWQEFGPEWWERLVGDFVERLPGGRVLDAGCGTGRDVKKLLDHGASEVYGVDASEQMLEIAREHEPQGKYLQGDVGELGFQDACFDGVFSVGVLHHLDREDFRRALGEFHRVLKPGGSMFLAVQSMPEYQEKLDRRYGTERRFHYYTEEWVMGSVESAGFRLDDKRRNEHEGKSYWLDLWARRH